MQYTPLVSVYDFSVLMRRNAIGRLLASSPDRTFSRHPSSKILAPPLSRVTEASISKIQTQYPNKLGRWADTTAMRGQLLQWKPAGMNNRAAASLR